MSKRSSFLPSCLCLVIFNAPAFAQIKSDTTATLPSQAPRIYIELEESDRQYVLEEISFINLVRDSKEAQVQIISSSQETGSGGEEHTFVFVGREDFTGMNDTLKYITPKNATGEEERQVGVRWLKLGLIRYIAKTPLADDIRISYTAPAVRGKGSDPWNYWVFELSLHAYLNGQKSDKRANLWGSFSADRITPEWKIELSLDGSYYEDKFEDGDAIVSSFSRSKSFYGSVVKSLGDHWSAGGEGWLSSSTYSNKDISSGLAGALEYNLFSYSQATHRQLRFNYEAGVSFVDYTLETIYGKLHETLYYEEVGVALGITQTWGSITTSIEGMHYFHDLSKNSLQLENDLSLRLFKGLSLDLDGGLYIVHNQLSLSLQDASYEDILLRRRQLATQYQYWTNIGLSYTFGSTDNNVVNPRFGN
jgi:hypothetical protein